MIQDLRFALRTLLARRGFTAVAVTVLALGIGANTAMFSVINAVLLRPLPYEKPEQLVLFWEKIPRLDFSFIPTSESGFLTWRERNQSFTDMAGFRNHGVTLTGRGQAESLEGMEVSASLFPILGLSAAIGRTFSEEESKPGGESVVLLTQGLWQRRFGSDPAIVGDKVLLDGTPYTVVGILPAGFEFPPPIFLLDNMFDWNPELYLPYAPRRDGPGSRGTLSLARLRPGVTVDQARGDLRRVAETLVREDPNANPPGLDVVLSPLHDQAVGQSRTPLLVLLGAVTLLLLIACVNVANLLLAKAASRNREIALRVALGAKRGRIVRQLLVESLVLALTGAALGTLLALAGLRVLVKLGEGQIPNMGPVGIDWTVLGFTLAAALATGVLFGLVPALQASRPDLNLALREGTRGGSMGTIGRRFRAALVMVEVGVAVILLVGAGLLVRSLSHLNQVQLGFRPQGLTTVSFELPANGYTPERLRSFYLRVLEEIRGLPGVESAGIVNHLPLGGGRAATNFTIEGQPADPESARFRISDLRTATPGYFETMGIRLLDGRFFQESDREGSALVILIDRTLAEKHWPGSSPLGKRITTGDSTSPDARWWQIVGVVESVKQSGLEAAPQPAIYFPLPQSPQRDGFLVLRSEGNGAGPADAVRRRIAAIDRDLPLDIRTMNFYVEQAGAARRSPTILLGIFAGLAVVLALVGLYGVMSYLVGQRTQEIGVRMALGARRGDVMRLVAGQTARLVAAGMAIGLAGAFWLSRLISGMLFEVSPADPAAFAAAAALFGLFAAFAGCIPARRASRVDPMRALRME